MRIRKSGSQAAEAKSRGLVLRHLATADASRRSAVAVQAA